MITTIAFDADDTLWQNETLFHRAQDQLAQILSEWEAPERVRRAIIETEIRNLPIYGYGIKAFTLSMIETALEISHGELSVDKVEEILGLGRSMLDAEVQLLPQVEETLQALSEDYRLMMVTKGDPLDQTSKLSQSGLGSYFSIVEILDHKTPETYQQILEKYHLDVQRFLMIGNSLRSDIAPVLALGGKAVHIPNSTTWELERLDGFDPTQAGFYVIESLSQLPALIEKITQHSR